MGAYSARKEDGHVTENGNPSSVDYFGYDYFDEGLNVDPDPLLVYPSDGSIELYHQIRRNQYDDEWTEYLLDNGYSFED